MSIFERVAEAKIRRGIEAGEFAGLAGEGEPLDLRALRAIPAEQRAANTVLRNAGVLPEELHVRSELAAVDGEIERRIAAGAPAREIDALRRRRMALDLKRNLAAERRLGRR